VPQLKNCFISELKDFVELLEIMVCPVLPHDDKMRATKTNRMIRKWCFIMSVNWKSKLRNKDESFLGFEL
jgi:hypothetical protein